jgi:hypothetical protein
MFQRLPRPSALAAAAWLIAAPAHAQDAPAITVTSPAAGAWIAADTAIDLVVTGPRPLPGRLAVMIGDVDWTALFTATSSGLRSDPSVMRLPSGDQALVVYLVTDAGWSELARLQLRILTRGDFERAEIRPVVNVNNKGQVALGREPEAPATSRDTFQDFTLNLGLGATFVRRGWTTTTQMSIVGVTNQPEAL